jgi:ABC-type transport system involved in cytochrome c biogenesis ATPase subunit
LLDEPTASLDAEGKQTFIQLIEEHRKSGGMAIIVTHAKLDLKNYGAIDLTGGGAA